jgi:hypothetical protein
LAYPFLYFTGPDVVIVQGLLVAVLIALGGYAQGLVRGARRLFARG